MHRLYLLRHAEASRTRPGESDVDRPLTERGLSSAAALGRLMRAQGHVPAFVFCSTALRARQTWDAVAASLADLAPETLHLPELYRGDAGDYRVILATAPTEDSVLLVGHNPAIAELASQLAAGGEAGALAAMHAGFPPGALAVFEVAEPWWGLAPRCATLAAFIPPQA
ncbi:histidine phosphatase family protein [Chelativorans sp. SCAU2101]|jgi:Phosphohistidine phosphatase SixA|uniref:Histidine phosphatase family protein n=1 Tax=Chelativorans petroleitrophicus TaxID=2975484 RepID=A0A9X2X8L5_9HYPH|nr:histidine phosphatase family protein [Chelativorans petroleitrophicus]MCT8990955.1 histidine phosphatase family protein [Chelativorans petroleitrophicus]